MLQCGYADRRFTETCRAVLVIATIELAAIIVTLWWWSGGNVELLTVDARLWQGQVWRLFSAVLPHNDVIHLVFNLYWVAVFGSRVEEVFGRLVTAVLLLILAAGSMLADYDLAHGGVGLSGVGYGLFGFLWVLSDRDRRFSDAVSPQIAQLFIIWFFLCIALTYNGTWHVANVAHGAGAGFGVLAGLAMAPPSGHRRPIAAAALVSLRIGCGAGGRRFCPSLRQFHRRRRTGARRPGDPGHRARRQSRGGRLA